MNTKIETKTSSKTGNEYTVVLVELVPGYTKQVFLDDADKKIIEQYNLLKSLENKKN
ncbi:MAG: hypothetical protein OSJ65_05155 [Bacilli bacterium]|nr:hypothetical protein [Bacilli bacterium]